jgi:hypothetical protein
MRKLAREAVIFILLTPLLFVVGAFFYLYHDAHKPVLFGVGEVQPIACSPGDTYIDQGRVVWHCENGVRTNGPESSDESLDPSARLVPKPKPNSDEPLDLSAGLVPRPKPNSELLGWALIYGFYGFPAGFGLWIFYRVVRFAVKG